MKRFYDGRGNLTAYAFACGYVQSKSWARISVRLWREHGAYHVRANDTETRARIFWDSFATLTQARKCYAGAYKRKAEAA
jgi:hypothetical protein